MNRPVRKRDCPVCGTLLFAREGEEFRRCGRCYPPQPIYPSGKFKLITNEPDAPWTLAQSFYPQTTRQIAEWARRAEAEGKVVKVLRDGKLIPLSEFSDA